MKRSTLNLLELGEHTIALDHHLCLVFAFLALKLLLVLAILQVQRTRLERVSILELLVMLDGEVHVARYGCYADEEVC